MLPFILKNQVQSYLTKNIYIYIRRIDIGRAKEFALSLSISFYRRSSRNSKMAYNNGEFIKS